MTDEILAAVGPTRIRSLGSIPCGVLDDLVAKGCRHVTDDQGPPEPAAATLLLAATGDDVGTLEQRLLDVRPLAGRNLVLLVSSSCDAIGRSAVEDAAIRAGYRRHPAAFSIQDFERNNGEATSRPMIFELIPDEVLSRWPLERLRAERDLHMDMTRESGPRADAHLVRYSLAAEWVRAGDAVLDCACGLGYGTAVLAARSPGSHFLGIDLDPGSVAYALDNFGLWNAEYRAASATDLTGIPDASFNTVVSFETLEHLEDYATFMDEAARVLRPGGLIIVSVPNLWADETGRDPNPHHHHVFDYKRCRAALEPSFQIIARYAQTAPGGTKLLAARRRLEQRSLPVTETEAETDTEWWIVVARLADAATDSATASPVTLEDGTCGHVTAGMHALATGDETGARAAFSAGLAAAGKALTRPAPGAGCAAATCEGAAQCARALEALPWFRRSPGLFWRLMRGAVFPPGDPALAAAVAAELARHDDLQREAEELRRLTRLRTLLPLRLKEVFLIILPNKIRRFIGWHR